MGHKDDVMTLNEKIKKVFLFFLLSSYFKPVGIAIYPKLNTLFQVFKLVNLIISILLIICLTKWQVPRKKSARGFIGIIVFEMIYIINSLLKEDCLDLFNNCFTNLVLIALIYSFSQSCYKKIFLNALNNLFTIEIVLHIFSFVAAKFDFFVFEVVEGGENTYLFGRDNYSAFITLPMLGIVLYSDQILKKNLMIRIKGYLLSCALFIMYLSVDSATAACAFFLMLLFIFFEGKSKKILRIIDLKKIIILEFLFLIGVIVYGVQNYFSGLLSAMFNKGEVGVTLNSRTIIWSFAWKLIKEKPILGWGILSTEQITNYVLYGAKHAHNLILEILIRTGFVGTLSYFTFLLWPLKNLKEILKSEAWILLITILCYLILSVMDAYPLIQAQYCLFAFMYCWKEYEEKY